MRMYEKEGEKYQYKEQHRRERKIAIKKTNCIKKKWFSLFAFKWK